MKQPGASDAAGRSAADAFSFSIVVPVLDEATQIEAFLQDLRERCPAAERIVVDGDSDDGTVAAAAPFADRLLVSPPGRACQMNAGAGAATGDVLVFLHVDTHLPDGAIEALRAKLAGRPLGWGRFDVAIRGRHRLLPVVAAMMNLRSRATGVATGDQAIFVTRRLFDATGGYPDMPLMEDIALSKRLRERSWPIGLRDRVTTSGRRWDANGVCRTVLTMWTLRLLFWLGVSPIRLATIYAKLKPR